MKQNIENKLSSFGETLGINREEIKSTLKRRRRQVIFAAIIPIAFIGITTAAFTVLGERYGGINIEDFRIFRLLRLLFGF